MIKHYTFDYNMGEAEASFKVDTEVFTNETAKATLEFFSWNYDKDADPIDEVLKKYAIEAIREATFNTYVTKGVIQAFEKKEGFSRIDGSNGIELMTVWGYEFDERYLDVFIIIESTVKS